MNSKNMVSFGNSLQLIRIVILLLSLPAVATAQFELASEFSDSGKLAVALASGPDSKTDSSKIWIVDFGNLLIYTATAGAEFTREEKPVWSPDGSTLAFVAQKESQRCLNVVHDFSSVKTIFAKPKTSTDDPDWYPDSETLLFSADGASDFSGIFSIKADGTGIAKILGGSSKVSGVRVSPRGDELLFISDKLWPKQELLLFNLKSRESMKLTSVAMPLSRPKWNNNGTNILFSYGSGDGADIWIHRKGANQAEKVVARPGAEKEPEWLDDGRRFFFTRQAEDNTSEIFLYNLVKASQVIVLRVKGVVRHLSWNQFLESSPPNRAVPLKKSANFITVEKPAPEPKAKTSSKPKNSEERAK